MYEISSFWNVINDCIDRGLVQYRRSRRNFRWCGDSYRDNGRCSGSWEIGDYSVVAPKLEADTFPTQNIPHFCRNSVNAHYVNGHFRFSLKNNQ